MNFTRIFNSIAGAVLLLTGTVLFTFILSDTLDGRYNTPFTYYLLGTYFFLMVYAGVNLIVPTEIKK